MGTHTKAYKPANTAWFNTDRLYSHALEVTGKTDIDGVLTVGDNKFTKNDVTLKGRIKMDHNWAFFPKNDKHIHVTNHTADRKPGAVIAAARFYTMN